MLILRVHDQQLQSTSNQEQRYILLAVRKLGFFVSDVSGLQFCVPLFYIPVNTIAAILMDDESAEDADGNKLKQTRRICLR